MGTVAPRTWCVPLHGHAADMGIALHGRAAAEYRLTK